MFFFEPLFDRGSNNLGIVEPERMGVRSPMSRYTKATQCQRSSHYPFLFPYDADRIEGWERHNLQNFLLRQFNFPTIIQAGDHVAEYWSHEADRARWCAALEKIQDRHILGSKFLLDDSTDDSFLAMCQKMVGRDFKATGGIAVRFTSPERRPVIRLTVVGIYFTGRTLYNGNEGAHVVRPANLLRFQEAFKRIQREEPLPDAWRKVTQPAKRHELTGTPPAYYTTPDLDLAKAVLA